MNARKAFAIWIGAAIVAFSAHSAGLRYHLLEHPRKVLIVVDASFPMTQDWGRAAETVRALAGRKNQVYAVATEKALVHGWAGRPDLGGTVPYAPRNLENLSGRLPKEAAEADEIVLVTNAPPGEAAKSGIAKVVTVR